ncbi:MAG: C-GCAxxG-C-C family protein [Thermodesulfobacteriota bacterium]
MVVGQEKTGRIEPAVVRAMGAFGGGIASSGGVCGIVPGAVAMISSIYSRSSLTEKEDPRMWQLSRKFMKKFEEMTREHGGMNCVDIARVDWRDREAVKHYYSDPASRRRICVDLVGEAAALLGILLEEASCSS